MSAAAVAARFGHHLFSDGGASGDWLVLVVVVAACVAEGLALGILQGRALRLRFPAASRTQTVRVTAVGVGTAWALAVLPTVLAGHVEEGPPVGAVVLVTVGLGLLAGSLAAAVQVAPLRGVLTHHPWRWVAANALTWPGAVALVFVGASALGADRALVVVAGLALVIGVLGVAVAGIFSGAWLGTVDGQPIANKVSLAMVEKHRFGMDHRLVGLGVTGRRSGRVWRFPVQYADHGSALVVVPVHAERKVWWRNLTGAETSVAVLDSRGWRLATARVLVPGDNGHSAAVTAYRRRWPHVQLPGGQPVVVVEGVVPGIPTAVEELESVG